MNYALHSFSLLSCLRPIGFFRLKVFNEAINASIKGRDHKYLCIVLFFPFVRFLSHWVFSGLMTHPHPLLAAGVSATPQKSPAAPCEAKPYFLLKPHIIFFSFTFFFQLRIW